MVDHVHDWEIKSSSLEHSRDCTQKALINLFAFRVRVLVIARERERERRDSSWNISNQNICFIGDIAQSDKILFHILPTPEPGFNRQSCRYPCRLSLSLNPAHVMTAREREWERIASHESTKHMCFQYCTRRSSSSCEFVEKKANLLALSEDERKEKTEQWSSML